MVTYNRYILLYFFNEIIYGFNLFLHQGFEEREKSNAEEEI